MPPRIAPRGVQHVAPIATTPRPRALGVLIVLVGLCLRTSVPAAPRVFILGDMEKPTGNEAVESARDFFSDGVIILHGAGNEVVAFQVVLRAARVERGLDARLSGFAPPAEPSARPIVRLFLAHYVQAQDASYSWFPPGEAGVLPWRGKLWPDALVPLVDPYRPDRRPVAAPFTIDPARHRNQALWVDVFIPRDAPAGQTTGQLDLLQDGRPFETLPVRLEIHPFNLPDERHVDAFGEVYRETGVMFELGVKFKEQPEAEWAVYKRYLQMGHAHRFLVTHRADNGSLPKRADGDPAYWPEHRWGEDWSLYSPYVGSILDGSLFTAGEGYVGPSEATPPSFYPAPFVEAFYGARTLRRHLDEHDGAINPEWLETWQANAAAFRREVVARGWDQVRFFAYILDEVDGPRDGQTEVDPGDAQVLRFHRAMEQIQAALDQGTGGARRIHLLWTSHTDAAIWADTPADLRPFISWWSPNAHALNLPFYQELAAKPGQRVWFYHSGHPATGNHAINQLGIDLRLWGLLCRRYGVDGSFWWSMANFGHRWDEAGFNPYENPVYRQGETRWGNGVLFYPGSRLTMIGYRRNIAGPIPSLRMKAYRRGLQDYEYCWLADRRGHAGEVDRLLEELIPAAFSEAPTGRHQGLWSRGPADYYRLRRRLADLIGRKAAEE